MALSSASSFPKRETTPRSSLRMSASLRSWRSALASVWRTFATAFAPVLKIRACTSRAGSAVEIVQPARRDESPFNTTKPGRSAFSPEPVAGPRAHARPRPRSPLPVAGNNSHSCVRKTRSSSSAHGQVVHALRDVREQLAYRAPLPVLPEFPRRAERAAVVVERVASIFIPNGLPSSAVSRGFGSNVSTCDGPPSM